MEAGGINERTTQAPGCTSGVKVAPKGFAPNLPDKDIFGGVEYSPVFKCAASLSQKVRSERCSTSRALQFDFALTLKKKKNLNGR